MRWWPEKYSSIKPYIGSIAEKNLNHTTKDIPYANNHMIVSISKFMVITIPNQAGSKPSLVTMGKMMGSEQPNQDEFSIRLSCDWRERFTLVHSQENESTAKPNPITLTIPLGPSNANPPVTSNIL